jgi:fluoroacetyl-CoA thioesterase
VHPGLTGSVELVVGPADTASALGSGDVDVLATPRVLALAEAATLAAIAGCVPEGQTTVGAHVSLDHVRPTQIGATVVATATLTGVDGRWLLFDVVVLERDAVIASGVVKRAVVDRDRFKRKD